MYTYEQKCVMNLGDAYTLLYGFVAGNLIGKLGANGERSGRRPGSLGMTGRRPPGNGTWR